MMDDILTKNLKGGGKQSQGLIGRIALEKRRSFILLLAGFAMIVVGICFTKEERV
jgi:hypothetical protein